MSFQFKQFHVADDRCAMKVGTDGVLLGAWAKIEGVKTILDIGTGSGLIALMLAQRSSPLTLIDAIEIEKEDARQASENVNASPWKNKINVINRSLQNFTNSTKYDLIVSNPPFFNSFLPKGKRKKARHSQSMTHEELLFCSKKILSETGSLAVILPTNEGNAFHALANVNGLFCYARCAVYSTSGKPQERWLFQFSSQIKNFAEEKLVISAGNEWSEEYKKLTKDFYLNL